MLAPGEPLAGALGKSRGPVVVLAFLGAVFGSALVRFGGDDLDHFTAAPKGTPHVPGLGTGGNEVVIGHDLHVVPLAEATVAVLADL